VIRAGVRACMLATLLAGSALLPAQAADPSGVAMERLRNFLDRVQSMRANFRQEIVDSAGAVVQASRGTMVLKRPGRCRWDYEEPFQRVVIADGRQLWLYEADLEQVTVRPLTAGLGETPAGLLTGERGMLDRFEYVSSWSGEGISWVRLKPKSADSDFDAVAIGFAGEKPVQLELNDRLGQQTRVTFTDIRLNESIAEKTFHLDVPEGVDVIREGEL
jgi:outer membrane lipoprotein carrier protein